VLTSLSVLKEFIALYNSVAYLVEAPCCKSEGRAFEFR
jgi:hypothetical protein